MKTYKILYQEYGWLIALKGFLHSVHIQIIRFVAGYRPLILDCHFKDGLILPKNNQGAYIAHNVFSCESAEAMKERK